MSLDFEVVKTGPRSAGGYRSEDYDELYKALRKLQDDEEIIIDCLPTDNLKYMNQRIRSCMYHRALMDEWSALIHVRAAKQGNKLVVWYNKCKAHEVPSWTHRLLTKKTKKKRDRKSALKASANSWDSNTRKY